MFVKLPGFNNIQLNLKQLSETCIVDITLNKMDSSTIPRSQQINT